MRPEGASSVMAARAPREVASDDAGQALCRTLDYFPTPPWAARAGGELIRFLDPEARTIWEPACGQGHMASALAEAFEVHATDIHPWGYGGTLDFFAHEADDPCFAADWIVSNPPFKAAPDFIRLALQRARRGVAMLLRLQFLEGTKRHRLMHGPAPITVVAPFAERVPMMLGRWEPNASSATAYAWFLWLKGAGGNPRLMSVPPGTRSRLTRAADMARWGTPPPAGGLLEALTE